MMKIKSANGPSNGAIKQKLKFKEYKTCLEATQFENRKNQHGKHKVAVTDLKENHK